MKRDAKLEMTGTDLPISIQTSASQSNVGGLGKILLAAEIEFADKGFDGAGMKALATRADVSQSLLHYHFGSKDNLYEAVIRERSKLINEERITLLRAVDLTSDDALASIFKALFEPALGPAGGGRAYARIFAGLIAGSERDQELVRKYYDPTARQFIKAIEIAEPQAEPLRAAQIYQYALGILASVITRDSRVSRLAGDTNTSLTVADQIAYLTKFAVGGALAILNR